MHKHSVSFILLVAALALPLAIEAAPAPVTSATTQASATTQRDPAVQRVALSWNGQHLAFIDATGGQARVELGAWPFRTMHVVDVGAGCRPVDLAWGRRSALLAILSQCGGGTAAADTTIAVIAPGNDGAARIVTRFAGSARHLRWGPYGERIGFLFTPRAGAAQGVAVVQASGGQPEIVTPRDLDVRAFTWAWHSLRIAYTATPRSDAASGSAKLYVQMASATAQPQVLADPSIAHSVVQGLQLALPRWSPSRYPGHILFIGGHAGSHGAVAGDIYSVRSTGGPVVNLTPNVHVKPSWFTFMDRWSLLATQVSGNEVQVTQYARFDHGLARQGRIWFGVAGALGNGRHAFGIATSGTHPRRIAYAAMLPGAAPTVHAGFLQGQPPPAVAPAGNAVADTAN
ncbi:MAG TPA: hypothetical protein VF292_00080 [Rhodanobacteraceae bacterium]